MAERKPARVVVVDDHPLFRRGVVDLLQSTGSYEIVGETDSASEIAALVHRTEPDVAVIDVRLGDASGLAVIPSLRTTRPDLRIIVLTVFDDIAFQRSARAVGAHGFVAKRDADTKLQEALVAVLAGHEFFEEDPVRRRDGLPSVLAEREFEVVRDVVRGYTNRSIAERLGISVKSVESYRARSMMKLGLSTRVDLVRYALETGLINSAATLDESEP